MAAWLRAVDAAAKRHSIKAVDYASVDSLTEALRSQPVHTVVSITSAYDGTQTQTQLNLLHAAIGAGCKRYAPGQWGFGPKAYEDVASIAWVNEGLRGECVKQQSKLEIGFFNQLSFMNYFGLGTFTTSEPEEAEDVALEKYRVGGGYKPGEDAAAEGVQRQGPLADGSGAFLLGLKNGIAELPVRDDGEWPRITLTTSRDVGMFVAASLDLLKWELEVGMSGDTVTMGELLEAAETITGKKFQVTKLTRQGLEEKLATTAEDDFLTRLWIDNNLAYTRDRENEVVLRPTLNRLCPDVKTVSAREYMEKCWANYQNA